MAITLENISHPCIKDIASEKYETMLSLEKKGKVLTKQQFLFITISLIDFLKTLHGNNIILGRIDPDEILLKPENQNYLPVITKSNMSYLRKTNNEKEKGDDTRRLCRMLLAMDHEDTPINKLLLGHAKIGQNDTTSTLLDALHNPADVNLTPSLVFDKISNAITKYQQQVLTPRETEYFSFRKHTIMEREKMSSEILQGCRDLSSIKEIEEKLDDWIIKLKAYSYFGRSRLAEYLQAIKRDIIQDRIDNRIDNVLTF